MPETSVAPFSTAREMVDALRAGVLSAAELADLHLNRIARLNPALNAVVTPGSGQPRPTHTGPPGPLHGLPLTIKDCIDTSGLPTTGGLPERAGAIPPDDAPAVQRLRLAGAVILGKTNVPPYASDWQSDNPLFGRTVNPWDLARTPGGSSGGGAAAVAAGLTPVDLGGDFVGSIRIPAAFCGIYGHKPTLSFVPATGHFPAGPLPNRAARMAVIGPLARDAGDLELVLDCIVGPENDEALAWSAHIPAARHDRLAAFRAGILEVPRWMPVDPSITDAMERVADVLRRAGAHVTTVIEDTLVDREAYHRLYMAMMAAMSAAGSTLDERQTEVARRLQTGDRFDEAWVWGLMASAADFIAMEAQRERLRGRFRAFFATHDLLVAPCTLVNAFEHRTDPYAERMMTVAGRTVPYEYHSFFPGLASLSGYPATAFPFGQTPEGLPVGLQAIGPYAEDRTPIRFAQLLARVAGGFAVPPTYRGAAGAWETVP